MKKYREHLPLSLFLLEIKFVWELLVFWMNRKNLKKIPVKKNKHPVLVLPGFATSDLFTSPLRKLLKQKGFCCYGWELGINRGYHQKTLEVLKKRIDKLYQEHGLPVILIGWSMGGIYARELSLNRADKIKKIITLGSPYRIPTRVRFKTLYVLLAGQKIEEVNRLLDKHKKVNFPTPILAINAKSDGIVPWYYCINSKGGKIKNFAVKSTHLGLPCNGLVVKKILETL